MAVFFELVVVVTEALYPRTHGRRARALKDSLADIGTRPDGWVFQVHLRERQPE
jgi:hypothetical protein